jgi:hypothetical protein
MSLLPLEELITQKGSDPTNFGELVCESSQLAHQVTTDRVKKRTIL